jgi:putative chitinase
MSLIDLQKKIGVITDGKFGKNTLNAAMNFYKMDPIRAAHFFAQVGHETGNFKSFTENLNYSTKGLLLVFKKYFRTYEEASKYYRNPKKIASRVYANRMGNRDEESEDGWKYRGRGALQLTGKYNYEKFSNYIKDPSIIDNPSLVTDLYSFESAFFFFDENNLWSICDEGVNDDIILKLTKKINGGVNGLSHRKELTYKYFNWVK